MKVGFQTVVFGPRFEDMGGAFDAIAAAGFAGVEIAQLPGTLGNVEDLLSALARRGLELAGLSGGSLSDRVKFCGEACRPYLDLDTWNEGDFKAASAAGFPVALHPHYHKGVRRLEDAIELLEKHPALRFLPDTAHLKIAGDDALRAVRETFPRITAVHVKDWSAQFGRSPHRYGLGFTRLGEGDAQTESLLRALRVMKYSGWVVLERDGVTPDPSAAVSECAAWASKQNLLSPGPEQDGPPAPRAAPEVSRLHRAEPEFIRSLARISRSGLTPSYDGIADAFMALSPCRLVTIWSCDIENDQAGLMAFRPDAQTVRESVLRSVDQRLSEVLSGITVERQTVSRFDVTEDQPGRAYDRPTSRFGNSDLIGLLGLKAMISVPVFNPGNFNHVRLVVNLFPIDPDPALDDDAFARIAYDVALAADAILDRTCSMAQAKANLLAGKHSQLKGFLAGLLALIRSTLGCEGVSIFLVNELEDKLELAETTGVEWNVPKEHQFYRRDEPAVTSQVWRRKEPLLKAAARRERGRDPKSHESVPSRRETCFLSPLVNARGEVIGVVRCQNKKAERWDGFNHFTADDVAVLEAIGHSAVPHLQVLLSDRRRAKAVGRITHELKTPVLAIRGAAELMQLELERKGGVSDRTFDYDYIGDIISWSELMRRLLGNADFYRPASEGIPLQVSRVLLLKDVVAPAVRQVGVYLRERKFSPHNIDYQELFTIPGLWLDRNQFQQLVFNLLSNSIKYSFADPKAFHVDIRWERAGPDVVVKFSDWGTGIPDGMEELIFDEGVRSPSAIANHVAGQGVGLTVVQQIARSHGGRAVLLRSSQPTTIGVYLPSTLTRRPPPAANRSSAHGS